MTSKAKTAKAKRATGKERAGRGPATGTFLVATTPEHSIASQPANTPALLLDVPVRVTRPADACHVSSDTQDRLYTSPHAVAPPSSPPTRPLSIRMAIEGRLEMADHTPDPVRGYVLQDLPEATSASVEEWIYLFLGVQPTVFRALADKISKEELFKDSAIRTHLKNYCYAKREDERYKPAIDLFHRIMNKLALP